MFGPFQQLASEVLNALPCLAPHQVEGSYKTNLKVYYLSERFGSGGGKNKIVAIKLLYLLSIRFYAVENMANLFMEQNHFSLM